MKNFIIVFSFFFIGNTVLGQELNFGFTAGYTNAQGEFRSGNEEAINIDAESGIYAGLLVEFGVLDILKIQPELLYLNVDDASFLQVPLMVKFYPIPKLYIQAGPQFTYTLEEILDDFTKLNVGIGAGAGFDIAFGLFVNARYTLQLNNYYIGSVDLKSQINFLSAGVGYKF